MKLSYIRYLAVLIIATGFMVLSLSGRASAGGVEPASVPEECYCAACGMSVTTEGLFVSQITLREKTVFFCDIGDMFLYYADLEPADVLSVFVKDYSSGGWVSARDAYYLAGAKVRTPMRYGIAAFSGREAAEEFMRSSGGGRVLSFGQALSSRVWEE